MRVGQKFIQTLLWIAISYYVLKRFLIKAFLALYSILGICSKEIIQNVIMPKEVNGYIL